MARLRPSIPRGNAPQKRAWFGHRDYPIRIEVVTPAKPLYEKITQHVPLFISILALALSIWSAVESRKHSRLSVRPEVSFFRDFKPTSKEVGLYIDNTGLGPAIIRDTRVYFDGKRILNLDDIGRATPSYYTASGPAWNFSQFAFTIKSGQRYEFLFHTSRKLRSIDDFKKLIYTRLFVIGTACSFYEECGPFCSTVDDDQCEAEERKIVGRARDADRS
jgi:hypothetical protein